MGLTLAVEHNTTLYISIAHCKIDQLEFETAISANLSLLPGMA